MSLVGFVHVNHFVEDAQMHLSIMAIFCRRMISLLVRLLDWTDESFLLDFFFFL